MKKPLHNNHNKSRGEKNYEAPLTRDIWCALSQLVGDQIGLSIDLWRMQREELYSPKNKDRPAK